jgi:hypothetical protein
VIKTLELNFGILTPLASDQPTMLGEDVRSVTIWFGDDFAGWPGSEEV